MGQDFFNIQYSKRKQELMFSCIYFIFNTRNTATSSYSRSPETTTYLKLKKFCESFGLLGHAVSMAAYQPKIVITERDRQQQMETDRNRETNNNIHLKL